MPMTEAPEAFPAASLVCNVWTLRTIFLQCVRRCPCDERSIRCLALDLQDSKDSRCLSANLLSLLRELLEGRSKILRTLFLPGGLERTLSQKVASSTKRYLSRRFAVAGSSIASLNNISAKLSAWSAICFCACALVRANGSFL